MLSLIVARASNGVIGKDGDLPWKLRRDMVRFKRKTMGQTVIMGRKTWESLPDNFRPLPGRRNVVLTTRTDYEVPEGVEVIHSLQEGLLVARYTERQGGGTVIIGGALVYDLFMPHVARIYLTEVEAEIEGDVYFSSIPEGWEESEVKSFPANEKNEYAHTFKTLTRVP